MNSADEVKADLHKHLRKMEPVLKMVHDELLTPLLRRVFKLMADREKAS